MRMVIPTLQGLEGLVADELRYAGFQGVKALDRRVYFEGGWAEMARANIICRMGERVQIVMKEFAAKSFEELYNGVKEVEWEAFIGSDDAFPVQGRSLDSALHSIPDCQRIIKKAVVDRLKEHYGSSWFEESGAVLQIRFRIFKDIVLLTLDTTGDYPLHKRGYRANSNDAPIRETLAAAIAELAWVHSDSFVCDPMCGSGTLVIEAAMKAKNIAPGLNRPFGAEKWGCVPNYVFREERDRAFAAIKKEIPFFAYASDIDPAACSLTQENAKKAHVDKMISVQQRDIVRFKPDICNFDRNRKAIILCNPPYGERLLDVKTAEELYKKMGVVFAPEEGYSYYIISPDEKFETLFGSKADRSRKLYNGTLKCQLYMYYSGKRGL